MKYILFALATGVKGCGFVSWGPEEKWEDVAVSTGLGSVDGESGLQVDGTSHSKQQDVRFLLSNKEYFITYEMACTVKALNKKNKKTFWLVHLVRNGLLKEQSTIAFLTEFEFHIRIC